MFTQNNIPIKTFHSTVLTNLPALLFQKLVTKNTEITSFSRVVNTRAQTRTSSVSQAEEEKNYISQEAKDEHSDPDWTI